MNNKTDNEKLDDYLKSNITNMSNAAIYKSSKKFTNFLDERQCELVKTHLKHIKCENYMLYGGTENCERCILGIFPEDEPLQIDEFPITTIKLSYSSQNKITHRDFLGSLMGLKINRDCVGDIVITDDACIAFVTNEIADFIITNLNKVGCVNVTPSIYNENDIVKIQEFEIIEGTVASLRLDCMVALAIKKSRTIATEMIVHKLVRVNFLENENVSHLVKPNDTISIRGKGKFIVSEDIKLTKKGRYFVEIKKLI